MIRDCFRYLQAGAVAARRRQVGALAEAFTGEIAEKRDIEAISAAAKCNLDSAVDKLSARLTFLQSQLGLIAALLLGMLLKLFLQ